MNKNLFLAIAISTVLLSTMVCTRVSTPGQSVPSGLERNTNVPPTATETPLTASEPLDIFAASPTQPLNQSLAQPPILYDPTPFMQSVYSVLPSSAEIPGFSQILNEYYEYSDGFSISWKNDSDEYPSIEELELWAFIEETPEIAKDVIDDQKETRPAQSLLPISYDIGDEVIVYFTNTDHHKIGVVFSKNNIWVSVRAKNWHGEVLENEALAIAKIIETKINVLPSTTLFATATATEALTNSPYPTTAPLGGGSGRIVFASNRDGNWGIYVMDADGNNQIWLSDSGSVYGNPAWSP